MGTITTLRPSGTSSGVGWTPSTGTLHGVTSDDSDATYATWSGSGSALILATPLDSPPAGELRHQVRLRARGEDGDAWWAVRLSSGALVAGATAQFSSSPSTVTGSWGFGAPFEISTVLYTYVNGQSVGLKIEELYIDVDSRLAPTFTPQVLDGSGTSTTTVADTSQPVLRASSVDLDDLPAYGYRYWVTLDGAIVWDTGVAGGPSANRQTTALDNGTYVAHMIVWSTIGDGYSYASDEETLTFTVAVDAIAAPDNPSVTPVIGTPFYEIEACAPYVDDLDGDEGWLEIQRVDCPVGGYLSMTGQLGSYASTPDPGHVFTDLEIQVKAQRDDDWRPVGGDDELVSHFSVLGNQRSWRLYLDSDGAGDPSLVGRLTLGWSEDGTSSGYTARATERTPIDPYGIGRIRVLLDTDNGAGGWTVTFQSRETDDGEWTQIGDQVINPGFTTSLYAAAGLPILAGAVYEGAGVPTERWLGRIYSMEIRDGSTTVVSPDFTNHLNGTTEFDDAQGNTWTISSPASLYSPVETVSIAMLGPLGTGECATWQDFTLPRSGVGRSCDHQPDDCCSYYRARTVGRVDGSLRVSSWSDYFNDGVPSGVIVMWPDTDASIPSGWQRVTELDGKYAKGIATHSTEPGSTGGAATHTHTITGHTHDTSHSHTVTGNTGNAGSGQVSTPGTTGTTAQLTSHTHSRPSTNSATVVSGSTSPAIGTGANDPARLDVIFIQSGGRADGVPDGALGMTGDISLSGWTDYANAANRFFKGAATAGNGGAVTASQLAAHTHSVAAHTHSGTSHNHTSSNTGAFTSDRTFNAGSNPALWVTSHAHPIVVGSSTSGSLDSGGSGTSGSASPSDPPYRNVRVKENTSGVPDLPVGLICAWRGPLGRIPDFWQLCDGTNGTMDMSAVHPRGATASIGSTGGSLTAHNHTSPSHNHTTSGHTHTETISTPTPNTGANISTTSAQTASLTTHTHSAGNTDSTTPTVASVSSGTLADTTTEPSYEEVAFIQLMQTPTPPPDPDTFCLNWNPDEHLIRTYGPDGPLWAPVLGKFEWDVDRPFTAAMGVNGSRFVTSASPGGRNLSMTAAVESEEDLAELRAVLSRPLVLISPSDASEVWAAPVTESVRIVKIGRIRQVTATFIGTGPQPAPQLADVG